MFTITDKAEHIPILESNNYHSLYYIENESQEFFIKINYFHTTYSDHSFCPHLLSDPPTSLKHHTPCPFSLFRRKRNRKTKQSHNKKKEHKKHTNTTPKSRTPETTIGRQKTNKTKNCPNKEMRLKNFETRLRRQPSG